MEKEQKQFPKKSFFLWPLPNSSVIEIKNQRFNILVSSDILATSGFRFFYDEWTQNEICDSSLFIPSFEYDENFFSKRYQKVKSIDCRDFYHLFQMIKSSAPWIYLTCDEYKTEKIIKESRKQNVFLRVYSLNDNGKVDYCKRVRLDNHSNSKQRETTCASFELPTEIVEIRRLNCMQIKVPQQGDYVYTSTNEAIRLKEEFVSNPESITYQTNKQGFQVKVYQPEWLSISYVKEKIQRMLENPIDYDGICWPKDMVYDNKNNFVGVLLPAAEGFQLKQSVMSQQGLEKNFPNWTKQNLVHLTIEIVKRIEHLQKHNVIFGVINTNAIFVKDENHVFFAEMDTYQIEGFPILFSEKNMQAPELQESSDELKLYNKEHDNYSIALLVFMLLMPGKFPYNKGKNKNISQSVKEMNFAFRYRQHGEEHGARERFGLWRFVWSHLGDELKQAFYYTFQHDQPYSKPENRKNAHFWRKRLEGLLNELSDPYDKESLKLYPVTFKRYRGTQTIKCEHCGIAHPVFYYSKKYSTKRICNSCLIMRSDISFVCKTCGKTYYYDYETLLKYEKLVTEKKFSMPTHCPYCRSDKEQCSGCKKMLPVYKFNQSTHLCFDCDRIARERIVKVYPCSTYGCKNMVTLSQGEVDYYISKFGNLPKRCKQCKEKKY